MKPFFDRPPMKLGWLTFALVWLVIAPLASVWAIVAYFDTELSHQRAESANLTTAHMIAQLVDKTFEDTFYYLDGHKNELAAALKSGEEKETNRVLKKMLFTSPSIGGLALYGPAGEGIVHMVIPGRMNHPGLICPKSPTMNWLGAQWFRDYEDAGRRRAVGNRYYDPCEPGIPNAAVVMPIEADGQELALLRATFDIPAMKEWFKPLKLPAGVHVTLVDGRRRVIYDSQATEHVTPKLIRARQKALRALPIFTELSKSQAIAGIYEDNQTGQSQILAYAPTKSAAWGALVSQPLALVDAPVKRHITNFTVAIGALLALGLVLVNLVRRSYSREAQLSGKLMNAVDELQAMNEIATEISQGLDVPQLLDRVNKNTVRLLGCPASMCLVWTDGPSPMHAAAHNLPEACLQAAAKTPGVRQVVETGRSLIINDYDTAIDLPPSHRRSGIKAVALAPIFIGGKASGVLEAVTIGGEGRRFVDHDVERLESVARQAGIALENAMLHEQTVNIATTLQQSLLPGTTPRFEGLQFGVCHKSATTHALVGGDFYDVFELGGDRLAVVMGDVAGCGVSATSIATFTKHTIHAFAVEDCDPVSVINRTNKIVSQLMTRGKFVTVFFGIFERDGNIRYTNCGHTPPMVLRPSDNNITCLEHAALPLGLGEAFFCDCAHSATLAPGETLLLYTDGLTETRHGHEFFGEARVKTLFRAYKDLPVEQLPRALCRNIEIFCQGKFTDDLAVLAIKKVPAPKAAELAPRLSKKGDT